MKCTLVVAKCSVLLLALAQAQEKLLFGYKIESDVAAYLDLAYHVRDMRRSPTIEDGMKVYTNDTATVSLQSLSTKSWEFWKSVPLYNVYVATFRYMGSTHEGDIEGNFDRQPANNYADTLVQDLFELDIDNLEATAAVTLNVVMAYWGSLYQFILGCERGNTDTARQTMTRSLDTAVALWIGNGQERNENQEGYMLYNLAEQAGARFGQDEGETIVNTQFLGIVRELKQDIEKGTCSMLGGYKSVHRKVKDLIKFTNVVLVQMLIHFMFDAVDNAGSSDFVEVLSLAILPQVHGCNTNLFNILVENTVNNDMEASRLDTTLETLQQALYCFDITCSEVGSYENGLLDVCAEKFVTLAGYTTTTDVADLSYVDCDIREMQMAMELVNWRAAGDLYAFGWNSDTTLRDIATGAYSWAQSDNSRMFESFYKEDSTGFGYSDVLIDKALRGVEPFAASSSANRVGVVVGSIQSNILYMAVVGQLSASLQACDENQAEVASLRWDGAAAVMIGSAEGENAGGQEGGQSILAISKQFCESFGTCEASSSVVGTILIASIRGGGTAVKRLACEEAQYVVSKDIFPNLMIPLLQGIIYYTIEAYLGLDGAHGYLLAYTQALLPYVKNDNDAAALQANANFFQNPSTVPDVPRAFAVVKNLAAPLAADCSKIGQMLIDGARFGLCPSDPLPPYDVVTTTTAPAAIPTSTFSPISAPVNVVPPSEFIGNGPTSDLAWGRYTFFNPSVALQDSMFTLDIRDMYLEKSPAKAGNIYFNPSKHAVEGLTGIPEIRSLRDFSGRASLIMGQDPTYNFYRLALFDDDSFDGNTTGVVNGWAYGNAIETLAIGENNGNSAQLGSKTAVVMEIWMMIAHRLYESARRCRDSMSSPELLDSAVGLWIGQEQKMGSFEKGWSIYALAQEAAELYGLEEKEARINTLLMEQFEGLRSSVVSCKSDSGVYENLRRKVDETVKNLAVPLLQHLLYHMSDNDYEYVELFALAFVPQTIGVDEGIYELLRDVLFQGYNRDSTITSKLLESFGKVLHAMRFTCEDLGDISRSSVSLKGIVGVLCDELTMTFSSNILAGYQTTSDIEELSRIDIDVLQIDLFLRANAYELAFDVYRYGRNSRSTTAAGSFLSLSTLASSEQNEPAGNLFQQFADFFMTEEYADKMIHEIIVNPQDGRFAGSSRRQRSEAVRRTIQTMVVYLQVVSRLRTAVDICTNSGDTVEAQRSVDEAVALFIGSIEGPFSGGSPILSGQMMYALAKEMCQPFGTCEGHGDAEANVHLEFAFSSIKEALADMSCDAAETILDQDVMAQLPIPVVQGSLFFADANDGIGPFSNSSNLTSGDAITETILPQIAVINETSAAIIFENMDFEYGEQTVQSGKQVVFNAFSSVLNGLKIDCSKIGTLQSSGLTTCGAEATGSDTEYIGSSASSTNLGNDLYVSTSYVQDRADIAIDVKEIEESLKMGKIHTARVIYLEGRNSPIFDADGRAIDYRTLGSFSTNASQTMVRNPLFHTFVYALSDEKGRYLGSPGTMFADSVVKNMFELDSKDQTSLAADAMVALNLWMEVANELFQTIERCSDGNLSDEDGINSIDEAAAYWIGDGQIAGDMEQGHLLYSLAEKMGAHFGLVNAGQSRTNSNILRLFHEAKMEVSLATVCRGPTYPPLRLNRLVDQIISMMVSVNMQALIHYLRVGGERSHVRIYAHAFVPLLATCDPASFEILKRDLIDTEYNDVHVENIVAMIRNSLHCFDLSCDDIGVHSTEISPVCKEVIGTTLMAEYKPTTDVRQISQIDLDILEMGILLEIGAIEAADDLYTFGRHASHGTSIDGSTLSLKGMATSSTRTIVPEFDAYRRFYDNDSNYADTLVRHILASDELSLEEKREIITSTSSFQITYMTALEHIYDALSSCPTFATSKGNEGASRAWDAVAAFLIGSLEGEEEAGSSQGQLLWSLSKSMCQEYGTCSDETPGSSLLNDEIATLLYAGRGAILDGSCENLEKISSKLVAITRGPFIQAFLSYAAKLSNRNLPDSELIAAKAYAVVRTLLPAIADIDRDVANLLELNFPLSGESMHSGLLAVSEAFFSVYEHLGVNCDLLGKSNEVDFCARTAGSKKKDRLLLSMFVILGTTTIAAVILLLRLRSKTSSKDPIFIPSNGELNHVSDLIPKTLTTIEESTTEDDEAQESSTEKLVVKEACDDEDSKYERAIEGFLPDKEISARPID